MASLTQDSKGNYKARKRLPDDVREEYGRLYGARFEAKFSAPKGTSKQDATRQYGEWLAEVEGRIANILAQHRGEGVALLLAPNRVVVILTQYRNEDVRNLELLKDFAAPLSRDLDILMRHEG
jgi:hypothetical protein